ncbi:MAG: hypothetical protein IPO53_00425 [Chitinophagaceae bacterium]|nr:hypothetical protein [Chitinophagaceae bacterium]
MRLLIFSGRLSTLLLLFGLTFMGCKQKMRMIKSPHYNFSEVFTDKLELKIKEISGLAWDSEHKYFITHNDESGKIFFLDKETKLIAAEYSFAGKGDYEDVAIYKGCPIFYAVMV